MSRRLESLPLCHVYKEKLATAGYETVEDLKHVRATQLTRDLNVSVSDAASILRACSNVEEPSTTMSELLQKEENVNHVVTFSAGIDGLIGGGVPIGQITELCGVPGIGKTQLCIQLAVDATIPVAFGGCGGRSIYIDTEGSFVIERVAQIAMATVNHIHSVAKDSGDQNLIDEADRYTLDVILKSIHYYRCHSYIQLLALSNILHQTISNLGSKVSLILIDSIASPFRHEFKDISLRHRLLSGLAQNLIKIADRTKTAVVLTNQMTTRSQVTSDGQPSLIPALGESWAHVPNIRIVLYWEESERKALLYKSPSHSEGMASYQITSEGIRDVLTSEDGLSNEIDPPPSSPLIGQPPDKRVRLEETSS